jgi:hypothetical protein
MLYARTQDDIYTAVRTRTRTAAGTRWTNAEIYNAINSALDTWDNRVIIPHVYTVTWASHTRDYTLPSYIKKFAEPQWQDQGDNSWNAMTAYDTRPGPDGNLILHLPYYPTPNTGRVVWWGPNSRLPEENPSLSLAIDADDTSLTVDDEVLVDDSGYIRIGNEWIGYSGRTLGDASVTLLNLERGSLDTTAASHVEGDPVLWGVVCHRIDLYPILEQQAMVYLHELMLTDGSAKETETHERVMNWHQARCDKYWRESYAPPRPPKFVLSPMGVGGPLYTGGRVFPAGGDRSSYP